MVYSPFHAPAGDEILQGFGEVTKIFSALIVTAAMAVLLWTSSSRAEVNAKARCMSPIISQQTEELNKKYLLMGGRGISQSHRAFFIAGTTSRVVVMFHGFLSSPEEMTALAHKLHQQTGDAIYVPLISGFGDNDRVTNASTLSEWQSSVLVAMDLASACFSHIDIVAYSMGAGLVTDFLIHVPEITQVGRYRGSRIDHVVLYSPYWLSHPLGLLVEAVISSEVKRRQSIPFRELANIIDPETLRELMPDFTNEDIIPLTGLQTLLDMKKQFLLGNAGTGLLPMSSLIVFSEDDPLIDTRFIPKFANRHFLNVKYQIYPAGSGIRHQTLQRATR